MGECPGIATSVEIGGRVTLSFLSSRDGGTELLTLAFPCSPPRGRSLPVGPPPAPCAVTRGILGDPDGALRGHGSVSFEVADADLGNYGGTFDVLFGDVPASGSFRVSGIA